MMVFYVVTLVASLVVLIVFLGKANIQAAVHLDPSNTHSPTCIILTTEFGPSATETCKHVSDISSQSSLDPTADPQLPSFNSSTMSGPMQHILGNARHNVTVTVTPHSTPDPYIHEALGLYYLVGIPPTALHTSSQDAY